MRVSILSAVSLPIILAMPMLAQAKSVITKTAITKTPMASEVLCDAENITPIYQIQGTGSTSPFVTAQSNESVKEVTTTGVVTARAERLYKGFFIQDPLGDGSPLTSDGIFVHWGASAPAEIVPGMEICVTGKVQEYSGFTQINLEPQQKYKLGNPVGEIAATPLQVKEGQSLAQALERFEGMKLVLTAESDMTVTRSFSLDYDSYRNNMVLSHQAPLMKATQVYAPLSAEAIALNKANISNQLVVESDYKADHGKVPYFPSFNAENGYIRIGDTLTNIEGVIGYSYDKYRFMPINEISASDFVRNQDRSAAPAIANQGDLRVASFNVLNFFNSPFGGDANPLGHNRGAKIESEMLLQRTKMVNAMAAMNADIIGLMEVENNGFGELSAIQNLVTALNDKQPTELAYQFVEVTDNNGLVGSDAIAVGILYRPAVVTLDGLAKVIATPEQHVKEGVVSRIKDGVKELNPAYKKYQRHSLMQGFKVNDQKLTIVVNHFKSKGSGCLEDWLSFNEDSEPEDLQGKCNAFRVSATKVIGESIIDLDGDVLVIGDLNAYGKEDPLAVLTDYDANSSERVISTASHTRLNGLEHEAQGLVIDKGFGLINLNTQAHGPETYSYSYRGELGNLDHALGNLSLAARLVAIEDWHINAVESSLFEYSSKYTGELAKSDNVYSSSDHDPVLIALSYPEAQASNVAVIKDKAAGASLSFLGLLLLSALGFGRKSRRLTV
ncbi:endonuclease [Shewanella sp. 10N.286.51.B7]|uniref:ExeM/NucH family extracellular endonuclease n=1 Tax=Shewanella sp. 10N.286.51.B7 TaxID=1880836 RepID=UPI000C864AC0|nr:ExeM/NucH family extracellular endonuclease [Shewanella sp. 10N.286.51.B7]PMG77942.1 endonuclease [Shewanella sp. 10N.286.51.B7]